MRRVKFEEAISILSSSRGSVFFFFLIAKRRREEEKPTAPEKIDRKKIHTLGEIERGREGDKKREWGIISQDTEKSFDACEQFFFESNSSWHAPWTEDQLIHPSSPRTYVCSLWFLSLCLSIYLLSLSLSTPHLISLSLYVYPSHDLYFSQFFLFSPSSSLSFFRSFFSSAFHICYSSIILSPLGPASSSFSSFLVLFFFVWRRLPHFLHFNRLQGRRRDSSLSFSLSCSFSLLERLGCTTVFFVFSPDIIHPFMYLSISPSIYTPTRCMYTLGRGLSDFECMYTTLVTSLGWIFNICS